MDDRFNTIAGWVLFAGIVALGSSIVAGEMFPQRAPGEDGLSDRRSRAGRRGAGRGRAADRSLSRQGRPGGGQQVFNKCMACHNADKGGANQLGPNLWGVIGEPIGQGKGFAFSDALAKKGGTWNWDNLSQWLTSPRAFAPGTKMTFAGLGNPQDRANVIAFLNQHSAAPKPLPAAPPRRGGGQGARHRTEQRTAKGREGTGSDRAAGRHEPEKRGRRGRSQGRRPGSAKKP